MEIVQAIVLFVLGVGAAFLAYFAWQGTNNDLASAPLSTGLTVTNNMSTPVPNLSPGIAAQA